MTNQNTAAGTVEITCNSDDFEKIIESEVQRRLKATKMPETEDNLVAAIAHLRAFQEQNPENVTFCNDIIEYIRSSFYLDYGMSLRDYFWQQGISKDDCDRMRF